MVLLGSVCLGFVDEFEILFCSPPVPAKHGMITDSCAAIGSGGSVSVATISHLHVYIYSYPRPKALQLALITLNSFAHKKTARNHVLKYLAKY